MLAVRHPYRHSSATSEPATRDPDEAAIYLSLVGIGAIPSALALAHGTVFGVDATLGLLMVGAGLLGLVAAHRR
jgi:hypothetical protein